MAAPIVGEVDVKTTDGATILTVDPDSSFIQVRSSPSPERSR